MPQAQFGKSLNLPANESKFVQLKHKGEKILFRIAGTPHYQTKHWLNDNTTVLCTKYNSDDNKAECKYCDQYVKLYDAGKKEEARKIAPVTQFYYPIVNMQTNEPQIFQFTAKSIHYTINKYAEQGVDVMACTWSIERTEEKKNYYPVLRLDEKPLTKEQKEAYEKAKLFKLEAKASSSVVMSEEASDEPM
jgi:hypothetical protein